jgi:hypothetical protein
MADSPGLPSTPSRPLRTLSPPGFRTFFDLFLAAKLPLAKLIVVNDSEEKMRAREWRRLNRSPPGVGDGAGDALSAVHQREKNGRKKWRKKMRAELAENSTMIVRDETFTTLRFSLKREPSFPDDAPMAVADQLEGISVTGCALDKANVAWYTQPSTFSRGGIR